MDGVKFDLDPGGFVRGLGLRAVLVEKARVKANGEVGDELLRLSNKEVPHDEATLQNSGVSETKKGETTVSYNTPYAAKLHEHPEYDFQKGRKGKYLEDPLKENLPAFRKFYVGEIRKALK